jgi:histidinol-phosphatase (PHP family)
LSNDRPKLSCRLDKADWHVHPDFSKDATGSIDEYCRMALKLGLEEICFTTHYDRDPFRKDTDPFMRVDGETVPVSGKVVKRYIQDVREADEKYHARGLSVKAGLEVDYAPHYEPILRDELACYDLDYTLGALHCLDHIAITSSEEAAGCFERKNMENLVAEYYRILRLAVESELFDVMAHLDIYRKHGLGFYGEGILTAHRGLVEPVLESMKKYDVGLEINTGILRRGQREPSPGLEIVELALSIGVRIAAFGSDAHQVGQLGQGIADSFVAVETIRGKKAVRGEISAD